MSGDRTRRLSVGLRRKQRAISRSTNGNTTDSGGGALSWIANLIAIFLIAAYIFAVYKAWALVGEEATIWSRRVELLGGLEALAFAAAGAVLGVTVQRPVVKAAQNRAKKAEAEAEDNAEAAEAGRALLAVVEANTETAEQQVANFQRSDRVEEGIKTEFQRLNRIAESFRRP